MSNPKEMKRVEPQRLISLKRLASGRHTKIVSAPAKPDEIQVGSFVRIDNSLDSRPEFHGLKGEIIEEFTNQLNVYKYAIRFDEDAIEILRARSGTVWVHDGSWHGIMEAQPERNIRFSTPTDKLKLIKEGEEERTETPEQQYWMCIIGPADRVTLPEGSDNPMRQAAKSAFSSLVGDDAEVCYSGWGMDKEQMERVMKAWNESPDTDEE